MTHKSSMIMVVILAMVVFLAQGCAQLETVNTVVGVYRSAKALKTGYGAYNMAKSMRDSEPLFAGYDNVSVEALIKPREDRKADEVVNAFKANMTYIVGEDLEQVKPDVKVCFDKDCPGKTLVVQFKEKGFEGNIVERLLDGDMIHGSLYFVDRESGTVLRQENLESLTSYEDLLKAIHTSVSVKLLKESKSAELAQENMGKLNSVSPIKEEYKKIFENG